jgi:hypothetical protein
MKDIELRKEQKLVIKKDTTTITLLKQLCPKPLYRKLTVPGLEQQGKYVENIIGP